MEINHRWLNITHCLGRNLMTMKMREQEQQKITNTMKYLLMTFRPIVLLQNGDGKDKNGNRMLLKRVKKKQIPVQNKKKDLIQKLKFRDLQSIHLIMIESFNMIRNCQKKNTQMIQTVCLILVI